MLFRCQLCLITTFRSVSKRQYSEFKPKFNYDFNTPRPVKSYKPRAQSNYDRPFIDYKEVHAVAGKGGDGCMSFLSLPMNEWAGPDGGDGGNGGHIIFEACRNFKSLGHLKTLIKAKDGSNGKNKNCNGKNAQHTVIQVPIGTIIKSENCKVIANLKSHSEYHLAARGGSGGKGNRFFLTNEERAPACAEEGALGEEPRLTIEMQIMAHVGLIGFPNAGKSTLLRALSRARPRVAAYPFTTLNPHVGIVDYDDYVQVSVADIPGLIEGAHVNRGLGFSFLRHIERCLCLLYVIDLSGHKCWTQLTALKYELEKYQTGLSNRPHAIVANKTDIPWAKKNLELLKQEIDLPVFPISAKNKQNIDPLLDHIRTLYDNNVQPEKEKDEDELF